MPLKFLLRYLANNEQLIQKLAESHAMRRAAQLSAFFFHKSKEIGYELKDQIKASEGFQRTRDEVNSFDNRVEGFKRTFSKELKSGFNELKEDIEKQQKGR